MYRHLLILASALFALALGCNQGATTPEVELGVTNCHRCKSVINDLSWAAADHYQGTARLYDDPGCLLATAGAGGSGTGSELFQDRGGSGAWIAGEAVWLARSDSFASPNGTGWAAYPSFAAAQEAVTAAGSGRIVRLTEALQAPDDKH